MGKKLFAVCLGGRAEKCNTELHDVVFVVGETLEGAYEQLLDKWFGTPIGLHIDSWMELRVVDGHEITISDREPPNAKRLYFVNLGAYADGQFMELHANIFIVADSAAEAKARARKQLCRDWPLPVHTDDLHDVDDCLKIDAVDSCRVRLEKTDEIQEMRPINGYRPIPKAIVNRYLARGAR